MPFAPDAVACAGAFVCSFAVLLCVWRRIRREGRRGSLLRACLVAHGGW